MSEKRDKSPPKLLGKKNKKKGSNEKKVCIYDTSGVTEFLKEEKTFKKIGDLNSYLNSLKNPYTIVDGKFMDLDDNSAREYFFYNENLDKIFQKEDNSEIYNDYKIYFYNYENAKEDDSICVKYQMDLDKLLLSPNYFFNLPKENSPKYYKGKDSHLPNLLTFFNNPNYNLFHLYMRKNAGTTLYLMKQMERKNEGFIYFDLRKLKDIISDKHTNIKDFKVQFKKFIFYSLFNVKPIYSDIAEGFKIIEKYYYLIINKIDLSVSKSSPKDFIKILFNSYIEFYDNEIYQSLLLETEYRYQYLTFILDHYNYEIEYDYLNSILNKKENDNRLKFLIVHSFKNKLEINQFFLYLDDNSFIQQKLYKIFIKGIEVKKQKILLANYEEMYQFDIKNLEDDNIKILKLYRQELLDNFGLINPSYFYEFIDYMKDKEQELNNPLIFSKFLKIISTEIELDIRKFYGNKLEDEYFYMSKYFKIYFEKKVKAEKNQIDVVKKNIPLDYFIIKFSKENKDILDIIPSCNVVKK